MSKSEEPEGKMRVTEPGRMSRIKRFLITTLVLAAILLGTFAGVVTYTDGGKELVEKWLERKLAMDLSIEKTHIGLPYVLVMQNVVSEDYIEGSSGLKANEIRVWMRFSPVLRASVYKAELNLTEGRDSWTPVKFSKLANVPLGNITDISRVTEEWRKNMSLNVSESSITWSPRNAEQALAGRISFSVKLAKVADKKMYYHSLSVDNVIGVDGARVPDVEREWLASVENPYIELSRAGSVIPASARYFWEPKGQMPVEVEKKGAGGKND